MANAIALFDARRAKWVNSDGSLTREAQVFVREVWLRIGGPNGTSDSSALVAATTAAQAAADQALIRSTSTPAQHSQQLRDGELTSTQLDAGGYRVNVTGDVFLAAQVFARAPAERQRPVDDAQAIIAARVFA